MERNFLNFIDECNEVIDDGLYQRIILKEKDYLNTRGKKKGTIYTIILKKLDIKDREVIMGKITELDSGKIYININKQKHPKEEDKNIDISKYFLYTDIISYIENNKSDFYIDRNSKGCYLEEYNPRKIKKDSRKIFYKAKFY